MSYLRRLSLAILTSRFIGSFKDQPRIDLQTEGDNVVNDRHDYSYRIVGKSEKLVPVARDGAFPAS